MSAYGYATAQSHQSPYAPFQSMAPASPAVSHSYSYLPHNPSPSEIESYSRRVQESPVKPRLVRPTNSKRGKSTLSDASSQFLDVQSTPVYNRRRAGHVRTDSYSSGHSSYRAPSLTRSSSPSSEEGDMRLPSGPNTPYSAKVALWRDDIPDDMSHYSGPYDEFGYLGKRHYEPASSSASSVYPSSSASSSSGAPASSSVGASLDAHQASPLEIEATCSAIEDLAYQLNEHILGFTFPKTLDFEETPDGPRLAYTSRNKPLMEHRHYLDGLNAQLDLIPSNGNSHIRGVRREVVDNIDQELKNLERMEKMVWMNMYHKRCKTPRIHVTAPSPTS